MAQVTTGIRSILSHALMYGFFQDLLGSKRAARIFVNAFIRPFPGMRILDLGCGPAALLDHLPETVEYLGVDISENYVALGRQRYGHRATFQCSAMEDVTTEAFRDFDLVLGLGLLHHLDQKPAECFFDLASRALKPGGCCLTLDSCHVPGQPVLAKLLIALDRGRNTRTAEEYTTLARTAFAKVEHTVCHDLLRLPYTHIIIECRH